MCFVLGPRLPAGSLGPGLGQAEGAGRHSSGWGLVGSALAAGAGSPAATPPQAPPSPGVLRNHTWGWSWGPLNRWETSTQPDGRLERSPIHNRAEHQGSDALQPEAGPARLRDGARLPDTLHDGVTRSTSNSRRGADPAPSRRPGHSCWGSSGAPGRSAAPLASVYLRPEAPGPKCEAKDVSRGCHRSPGGTALARPLRGRTVRPAGLKGEGRRRTMKTTGHERLGGPHRHTRAEGSTEASSPTGPAQWAHVDDGRERTTALTGGGTPADDSQGGPHLESPGGS